MKDHLLDWLNAIPFVPSHYCRKSDTYAEKKFIYPGKNLTTLYQEYCSSAEAINLKPASDCYFNVRFKELNLSVFRPRKDLCDLCISAKEGNISPEEHAMHINEKDLAQNEKKVDKECSDIDTSVWTMDLQCVLLCPKTNASTMYYKQKLQVHNLTIYNLKTKEAFCHVWTEVDGDMSSEMFSFIQYSHFKNYILKNRNINNLIIWSDGCGYQNRNVCVSNTFIHLANEFNINISQKFLVSGHTQMECDSMHSLIERKIVTDIYTPRDYIIIMKTARINPFPFSVNEICYNDVTRLNGQYLQSIRPGRKVGDPTVHSLRGLMYTKDRQVLYKLTFHENSSWQNLPQRINWPNVPYSFVRLFESPIKLRESKFRDLMSMKSILPKNVHSFYDNLPFEPK